MSVKWMITFCEKHFPPYKQPFHLTLTQLYEVHFLSFAGKETNTQRSGLSSII